MGTALHRPGRGSAASGVSCDERARMLQVVARATAWAGIVVTLPIALIQPEASSRALFAGMGVAAVGAAAILPILESQSLYILSVHFVPLRSRVVIYHRFPRQSVCLDSYEEGRFLSLGSVMLSSQQAGGT